MLRRQVMMTNTTVCFSAFIRSPEKYRGLTNSVLLSLRQYSLQAQIDTYTLVVICTF